MLWEIFTHGGIPYPGMMNLDIVKFLQEKKTMQVPKDCPLLIVNLITKCWEYEGTQRPSFQEIVETLKEDDLDAAYCKPEELESEKGPQVPYLSDEQLLTP